MTETEKAYAMALWFIKTLCIETNADKAIYTVNGMSNNKTGENLGDWEIVVKRKKVTKK